MGEETHVVGRLGRGAARAAPTAPHATEPEPARAPEARRRSGPERFWSSRPWRLASVLALVASAALHYLAVPLHLLPQESFVIRDVDGSLTIPVDLLQGEPSPPPVETAPTPPPPPPATATAPDKEGEGPKKQDAGPKRPQDAGADGAEDAARADAGDAEPDGSRDAQPDAGEPPDGAIAFAEDAGAAGPGTGDPRTAAGMIGAAGAVQAGPQNVVLTVNFAAIRAHPEGKRLGPLITAVPQWDDFLQGTQVDPLQDIDWVSINGPALLHTEKDVILVHYAAPDAAVDKAIASLGKRNGHGGTADVGVPGVKAVKGYADRAERVFIRPQPHVLAVVPGYYAKTAAQILVKASVPRALKRPAEAMRLTLVHPHGPVPGIPESVTELRLWIVPRNDDGGADIYGEGDTPAPEACRGAVEVLNRLVQEQNSFGVQLLTHGLLNRVEITPDGSTVKLHVSASRDQIQVVLAFVAGRLGVNLAPEPDSVPSGVVTPSPRPPPGAPGPGPRPPAPAMTPR